MSDPSMPPGERTRPSEEGIFPSGGEKWQVEHVLIRPERGQDHLAIRRVNDEAFGGPVEGALVDALRTSSAFIPGLSIVAEHEGAVVGHILLTRVGIAGGAEAQPALALAPMAVLPAWQRRGIGSALVRHALVVARDLGHSVVVVIGHPAFYPRFGFRPARPLGLESPFDAPDDAFLVMGLRPGAADDVRGMVQYPPAFLSA